MIWGARCCWRLKMEEGDGIDEEMNEGSQLKGGQIFFVGVERKI